MSLCVLCVGFCLSVFCYYALMLPDMLNWGSTNKVWPQLKLIMSTKALFPNTATFSGPRKDNYLRRTLFDSGQGLQVLMVLDSIPFLHYKQFFC